MIEFIQHSGIVTAMVGLLNAAPPSRLYNRLKAEKRLLSKATGNNTDGSINFIPKMDSKTLINGYKQILQTIYSPRNYYLRLRKFLEDYEPGKTGKVPISGRNFLAALKSFWRIGCLGKEKHFFWKFFFHTLSHYPSKLGIGLTMAVYGIHFQKIAEMI